MKENDIKKIMEEIGNFRPTEKQTEIIEDMASNYMDKSEDEVFFEVIKMNDKMKEEMSQEEYEEMFEKLNRIRPLLNEEQSIKLNRILDILDKNK
ncbi:hypothetical protein KQI42_05550 [Tissierella sp. MSJ-40]|uniref:Uncharacterized protein n=1 Tax=Tissierella simiarum TaxID=2841534 RepID=A0ABS6E3H6_9FIRM|nr:hypothetical protein [Tissierella simiarum]MBU5437463.1 hypothetical protein [Tissierella simiarum]